MVAASTHRPTALAYRKAGPGESTVLAVAVIIEPPFQAASAATASQRMD
jgi:hypothetical protein